MDKSAHPHPEDENPEAEKEPSEEEAWDSLLPRHLKMIEALPMLLFSKLHREAVSEVKSLREIKLEKFYGNKHG